MKKLFFVVFLVLATGTFGQPNVSTCETQNDKLDTFDRSNWPITHNELATLEKEPINGTRKGFYPNGQLGLVSHYKNGKEEGPYLEFWPDGSKKVEMNLVDGVMVGQSKQWAQDGTLIKSTTYNKDSIPDGPAIGWYENGEKRLESFWKDSKKEGKLTAWYKNGQLQYEIEYRLNEVISKEYRRYHYNGQLHQVVPLLNGRPHGELKVYHCNGQLAGTGTYRNGLRHGDWAFYYDTGELACTGSFKKAEVWGRWTYFDKSGKKTFSKKYRGLKFRGRLADAMDAFSSWHWLKFFKVFV